MGASATERRQWLRATAFGRVDSARQASISHARPVVSTMPRGLHFSSTRCARLALPLPPAPRILPRHDLQQPVSRHAPQCLNNLAVLPAPSTDISAEILMPALLVCLPHFLALRYCLASCSNNHRKHSPPLPTSSTPTHTSEHLPCSCSAFITRRGSSPLAAIQCISVWLIARPKGRLIFAVRLMCVCRESSNCRA